MHTTTLSARRLRFPALLFIAATGLMAQDRLGIDWREAPGNPAITPGDCLSWRCAGVTDPSLVLNADGSVSVWFTTIGIGHAASGFYADGPYFGRATGTIGGRFSFLPERPAAAVGPDGTWDKYLETASVRSNSDGSLTMWYMGHPTFGISDTAIGQMTSPDGVTWPRPESPIYRAAAGSWDSMFIAGPTVVKDDKGNWYLYYSAAGPRKVQGVGLLTSTDGVNWTPYGNGPVLPSRPGAWDSEILEQCVLYYRDQFWMWYSAYVGPLTASTPISIGLATSADGINWTRHGDAPVIGPGEPGSWNDLRVLAPDVVVQPDGSFLMVAYGMSKTDITAGSIGFWRSLP